MPKPPATIDILDRRLLSHLDTEGPSTATRLTQVVTGQSVALRRRCSAMVADGRAAFVDGAKLSITAAGRASLAELERSASSPPIYSPSVASALEEQRPTIQGWAAAERTAKALTDAAVASLQKQLVKAVTELDQARAELDAANQELELTAAAIYGKSHDAHDLHKEADRLRRDLLRSMDASPRALEAFLARELLAELEDNTDASDPIRRPLAMLRAIVTGEVPRG